MRLYLYDPTLGGDYLYWLVLGIKDSSDEPIKIGSKGSDRLHLIQRLNPTLPIKHNFSEP